MADAPNPDCVRLLVDQVGGTVVADAQTPQPPQAAAKRLRPGRPRIVSQIHEVRQNALPQVPSQSA